MAKVSIQNIDNLQNETTAIGRINANFAAIQTVIDTLLSRDGASPNQMVSLLDMNNRRIINLPTPVDYTDAARHGDLQLYVDEAEAARDAAQLAETNAELAEVNAEAARDEAVTTLHDFESKYLGSLASDPTVDENGNPIQEGALYFNTTVNQWRVYTIDTVFVVSDVVLVGADEVEIRYWTEFPQVTLRSLNDVSADTITNGQILVWSSGTEEFVNVDLNATRVTYSNATSGLAAVNVQAALDEIVSGVLFNRYDFSVWIKGLLAENDTIFRLQPVRTFIVPAVTTEFKASAETASVGTQVLTLKKNGVQFGTVTFTSSATGVWAIPGDTVITSSDIFTITTGTPVDTALRNISLTFAAKR